MAHHSQIFVYLMEIKLMPARAGITNTNSSISNPVNGRTMRKDKADKITHQRNAFLFNEAFMSTLKIISATANPTNGMKPT